MRRLRSRAVSTERATTWSPPARLAVGAASSVTAEWETPHASATFATTAGVGNFLAADDSPWELLMATGLIYALPPAAIYYTFKRYMVGGLTAGAVKS